ncbi:MAG TPA: hypothetical protein VIZ90_01290 [Rhizobiaceae bacterium]
MSASEALRHDLSPRRLKAFAFVLLATDLLLIGLHILWGYDHWIWSMEDESGLSERFQHLKWAAASMILLVLATRRRAMIYGAWALLFAYFAVDDSIQLHERIGSWLIHVLDLGSVEDIYLERFSYFYLRAQEFGELIFAAGLGAIVAAGLFVAWPCPDAIRERTVARRLVAWLLLFALFAVGFDLLHTMAYEIYPPAIEWIGVIEDGGEMICASLLVAGLAWELART